MRLQDYRVVRFTRILNQNDRSKYLQIKTNTMATINTEVDVDIDQFDTSEIIDELKYREKSLDESEIKRLDKIVLSYKNLHLVYPDVCVTTRDKMKYDQFMKNFDVLSNEHVDNIIQRANNGF